MPPLRYKYIGSEQHLTFDSIRRLVLYQLSNQDRRRAWKHIDNCPRCRSIYESLAKPEKVVRRRSKSNNWVRLPLWISILIGLSLTILHFGNKVNVDTEDVSILYTWGLMKIKNHEITGQSPRPPKVEPSVYFKENALISLAQSLEYLPRKSSQRAPKITAQPSSSQKYANRIHGIITANDAPLQGVTIMVPDSKTAKVSNIDGKYFIEVPDSAATLVFIYKGKHLSKKLNAISGRLDVNLSIENMEYPEFQEAITDQELIADN